MVDGLVGSILVVDDEAIIRELFHEVLVEQGHQVRTAANGEEAIAQLKTEHYDVVLSDLAMGHIDGIDVLRAAKRVDPTIEVIIVTGKSTLDSIVEAIREGAYDYLIKPSGLDRVTLAVAHALSKRQLTHERDQLVRDLHKATVTHRELFELAIRDGLTDLYNHRYFVQELERSLNRYPLSLVLFDTDKFKQYNDTYGHLEGDKVLQKIADTIRASMRHSDIGARYGGDEFVVILPETNKEQAAAFAERCATILSKYYADLEPDNSQITLSGGVASCPQDARDADTLIRCADEACYKAKQAGGNQVCVHPPL